VAPQRAEALERIQVLNPQAKLTFESADIADKDEDYLRVFNVICISNQTLATIVRRPTHVLPCVVRRVSCRADLAPRLVVCVACVACVVSLCAARCRRR